MTMTQTDLTEARRQIVLAHETGELTDGEYRLAMVLVGSLDEAPRGWHGGSRSLRTLCYPNCGHER